MKNTPVGKKYYLTSGALVLAYCWVSLMTAWLSDDSFITLREVWNVIHGQGFTWNFGQRVQAFTHPAWALLLTLFTFGTGEIYFTTILVSILLSILAIVVVIRFIPFIASPGKNRVFLLLFPFCLLFSKAFTDYLTSGLENPLSYFLAGISIYLACQLVKKRPAQHSSRFLFLAMALLFLNRFDYAVLFLPLVIYVCIVRLGFVRALKEAAPGIVLIAGWFIFAIIYFGFPFPNTYYAKLTSGYAVSQYFQRGLQYYQATLHYDPITLVLVFAGIAAGLFSRNGVCRALAIGMLCYCLYILKIGGDFMIGRYFSVLAYISLFTICIFFAGVEHRRAMVHAATGVVFIIAISLGSMPLLSTTGYVNHFLRNGIADERGYWYERFGLLAPGRQWPIAAVPPETAPFRYDILCGGIGAIGLRSPDIFIIDNCGLTDAFISRLPAEQVSKWRIGHHVRKVPRGYGIYLTEGEKISDVGLQKMLDDVSLAISGNLFDTDRVAALFRLNITRPYSYDTKVYTDYAAPLPFTRQPKEVGIEEVRRQPVKPGTWWWAKGNVIFDNKLLIRFAEPETASNIEISLGDDDRYKMIVNGSETHAINPSKKYSNQFELETYSVDLNGNTPVRSIEIIALQGDRRYAVGHVRLKQSRGAS